MKKLVSLIFMAGITAMAFAGANADTLSYKPAAVRHVGPFSLKSPVVLDSVNVNQEKFSTDKLIDTPLSLVCAEKAQLVSTETLNLQPSSLNLIAFDVVANKYVKADLKLDGAKHYKAYVDGKEVSGKAEMQPGFHTVSVKLIPDTTVVSVSLKGLGEGAIIANADANGKRKFMMKENLGVRYLRNSELSPSGRWAIVEYSWYDEQNRYQSERMLVDTKTGQSSELEKRASWMPSSERYYYTENLSGKDQLKVVDPATGAITTLSTDLPSTSFTISPTEDFLIFTKYTDGPKKEDGVYQIITPNDRQPGWRNRGSLSRYDLKTGFIQPLTYTYHNLWLTDISQDGKHVLFAMMTDSITQRPTQRQSIYDLDLETLETKLIVEKDGFISSGCYAGKGNDKIVFYGGTESFSGIGKRVPEGRIPNQYDYHLYLLDLNGTPSNDKVAGKVTPLTADDKTSIESVCYSPVDGNVYYTAQNSDSVSLYRLDMKTLKSMRVSQPLEVVNGFSIASKAMKISVYGSSACVPYTSYYLDAAKLSAKNNVLNPTATKVLSQPNKEFLADVALGTAHAWKFTCKRGYEVTGHYYLPADFDPAKKYPVIVHYYGGCSPTSRRFGGGGHYPAHYWNSLGYIALTINPSGASGFGQEWASRHVNTMGEGVAEDIIEATDQFTKDVPQADREHLGCVSASYGGFMTQCILTKTDLFACGISHAGISDHTSYWGEGYWGYSYSEISAADSYPWTRKDLFVDRSPLFNANKIHKPLLFTHGTVDTNVPIGESIQMYTALKLLGIPTAFIMVEGENHGIMDPTKRTKWINSMVAWFNKYLKNDDSWWNAIYTPKEL